MSEKRIYAINLNAIPEDNNETMDTREKRTIKISGFKLCMEVNNQFSTRMYFNYAIVAYKGGVRDANEFATGVANAGDVPNTVTSFFRSRQGNVRALNLDNNRTGLECHCLPINTDFYKILTHKRYVLGAGSTGLPNPTPGLNNGSSGKSQITIDKFIPLGRNMRFSSSADDFGTDPVYLICWTSLFQSQGGVGETGVATLTRNVTTYYKDQLTG